MPGDLDFYHKWKHELGEREDHWLLTAFRAFWDVLSRAAISVNSLCFSEAGLPTRALLLGSYRSLWQHPPLLPHSLARFANIQTSLDCLFRKHSLVFSLCTRKKAPEVYSAFETGTSSHRWHEAHQPAPLVSFRDKPQLVQFGVLVELGFFFLLEFKYLVHFGLRTVYFTWDSTLSLQSKWFL